ncbi:glutaredoxin domain-containing protein [Vibrio tapetis]|uniref:Putative Glutaredoxin and related protein n=1 Tax=Vibrio tapetis subsp. tapetis TaxID=1671868 RepID=A0A2N8ZD43_9VIBR|nr:glutaredoxin [Vibrio tapetis]SON49817.1 putative Glutaredoxin and related protein [Vibrio tapetis subsp. tapetis]
MNIDMFSKEDCSQCTMAANWLQQQGYDIRHLKLNVDFDRETLLSLFPSARTYPQFRLDGRLIGDLNALKQQLSFACEAQF